MGAISDNITNINTIGFKGPRSIPDPGHQADLLDLLFPRAACSRSRATRLQGLLWRRPPDRHRHLRASAIFVANEKKAHADFTASTRPPAPDRSTPTTRAICATRRAITCKAGRPRYGAVTPATKTVTIPNQNIISKDYLAAVNLNWSYSAAPPPRYRHRRQPRPRPDTPSSTPPLFDVQFFDSLGNANTASFTYTKTNRDNQWDAGVTRRPASRP